MFGGGGGGGAAHLLCLLIPNTFPQRLVGTGGGDAREMSWMYSSGHALLGSLSPHQGLVFSSIQRGS